VPRQTAGALSIEGHSAGPFSPALSMVVSSPIVVGTPAAKGLRHWWSPLSRVA